MTFRIPQSNVNNPIGGAPPSIFTACSQESPAEPIKDPGSVSIGQLSTPCGTLAKQVSDPSEASAECTTRMSSPSRRDKPSGWTYAQLWNLSGSSVIERSSPISRRYTSRAGSLSSSKIRLSSLLVTTIASSVLCQPCATPTPTGASDPMATPTTLSDVISTPESSP